MFSPCSRARCKAPISRISPSPAPRNCWLRANRPRSVASSLSYFGMRSLLASSSGNSPASIAYWDRVWYPATVFPSGVSSGGAAGVAAALLRLQCLGRAQAAGEAAIHASQSGGARTGGGAGTVGVEQLSQLCIRRSWRGEDESVAGRSNEDSSLA